MHLAMVFGMEGILKVNHLLYSITHTDSVVNNSNIKGSNNKGKIFAIVFCISMERKAIALSCVG